MIVTNNDDIVFQTLDWDYFHEEDDEGNKKFVIRLFGKTKNISSLVNNLALANK
jgi:hypothetical protein